VVPVVTADVRAWLRRLDETHQKATPGVWVHYDPTDGTCWEAPADAAAIVSDHNAVPDLIAALTAVLDLADELDRQDSGIPGDADHGPTINCHWVADRIRAVVAAAGGEGE
jgi:hypothetical protein